MDCFTRLHCLLEPLSPTWSVRPDQVSSSYIDRQLFILSLDFELDRALLIKPRSATISRDIHSFWEETFIELAALVYIGWGDTVFGSTEGTYTEPKPTTPWIYATNIPCTRELFLTFSFWKCVNAYILVHFMLCTIVIQTYMGKHEVCENRNLELPKKSNTALQKR